MTFDEFEQLKKDQLNLELELFEKMYSRGAQEEPESFILNLSDQDWQYEYEIFLEVLEEKRMKYNAL